MPDALFDPLAWLRSKAATPSLDPDGHLRIQFEEWVRRPDRERIKRVIAAHYEPLLRLQLDVPPGEQPRTVRQLLAVGKIRLEKGRYVKG